MKRKAIAASKTINEPIYYLVLKYHCDFGSVFNQVHEYIGELLFFG
jgi:hypothetical protein